MMFDPSAFSTALQGKDKGTDCDAQTQKESFSQRSDEDEIGAFTTAALVNLHMALEHLPEEKKTAYTEAMRTCPHLVETESDPLRFLCFHQWDPWAAAERLCNYWEIRRRIFGDRLFCRPLDMSGEGAFEPDDIAYIECGTWAILPEDSEGRPVQYTDRNRIPPEFWDDCRCGKWTRRSAFWLHHVLSLHPATQNGKGWVLIFQHMEGGAKFSKQHQALLNEFYESAFPVRMFSKLHGFVYSSRRHHFLDKLLPKTIPKLISMFRKNFYAHVLRSPDQCFSQLEPYGFSKAGIPEDLGGTWTYDSLDEVFRILQQPGATLEFQEGGILKAIPPPATTKEPWLAVDPPAPTKPLADAAVDPIPTRCPLGNEAPEEKRRAKV